VAGAVLVAAALVIIWTARASIGKTVYVSGLGAAGESTAEWFELALLLLVGGGFCVAWAVRSLRGSARWLVMWSPSVSLVVSSSLFFVASQVPCTTGCPLPVGDAFTWQDLVHTIAAILAFGAAALAMLQVSFVPGRVLLRRVSLTAGVATALISAAGGILSLLQLGTDVGSMLELLATTVGMGWLTILGIFVAVEERSALGERTGYKRRGGAVAA